MKLAIRASAMELVDRLFEERFFFGEEAAKRKTERLRQLSGLTLRSPHKLKKLHRTLCYIVAYPDSREVNDLADGLLKDFERRIEELSDSGREALENSRIEGTSVRLDFAHDVVDCLVRYYGKELTIDWDSFESPENLDEILLQCIANAEVQTFDDGVIGTRDWIDQARGTLGTTDLTWLWSQMKRGIPSARLRAQLYDKAEAPLVWLLTGPRASQTTNRIEPASPFCLPKGIFRFKGNAKREVRKPLGDLRPVRAEKGEELIRLAVTTLAARHREVYADCCGNPEEVYDVDVGRGTRVIVIGVLPEYRLNLEGSYGYMILRNGMPCGYGGVSPLFHQGNTGINLFEEFRRGETAFLFVQVLRVFHNLFGTTCFVVSPYQTGHGNTEAIDSGAFWFYYKLMFRPRQKENQRVADREWAKIASRKRYRTGSSVLRKLAKDDLLLTLGRWKKGDLFEEKNLGLCASGVTDLIAGRKNVDRKAAARSIVARVARDLGVEKSSGWPLAERRAFENMAPLVALIEDLASWKAAQKRALVRLMRAKGSKRERTYVRLLKGNSKLRRALSDFCASE